ncbi:MAG: ATP-binding protein, partial [Treponema sp.]|nr:ATP-binding protein [Treponema sp.]
MQFYSFSPFGYEGALVTVEVDLRRGIPAVDLVGLADNAVKESRERMQAAIRNSGFELPPERVLISLSPADLKKEGAGFDLPITLAVLTANAIENGEDNFLSDPILVMGELELSGKIRSVKGVHAAVSTAASCGIMRC